MQCNQSKKENIFQSWFTYFTIIYWIANVVVWLSRLNRALSIFNPLFIIPMLQCSFIFFAILSGGIFFKEFNSFSSKQWVGFWFGIIVMFSGLVLLTPRHRRVEEEMVNVVTNLLESKEKENVQNNLFRSEQGTCFYEKRMPVKKTLLKKSSQNLTSRDKASDHSSTRLPWVSISPE